jgi:hypothetical protein
MKLYDLIQIYYLFSRIIQKNIIDYISYKYRHHFAFCTGPSKTSILRCQGNNKGCAMESSRLRLRRSRNREGDGRDKDQETRVARGVRSGLKMDRRWVSAQGIFWCTKYAEQWFLKKVTNGTNGSDKEGRSGNFRCQIRMRKFFIAIQGRRSFFSVI